MIVRILPELRIFSTKLPSATSSNPSSSMNARMVIRPLNFESSIRGGSISTITRAKPNIYKEKDHIRLQPENDAYEPLHLQKNAYHTQILGKCIATFLRH